MTRRFPQLDRSAMTPEQGRVADAIMSGPRKSMNGPFNAWLRRPELADRLQKVGEYVLFNTVLPARLRELAIILVSRRWSSHFEWFAHRRMALEAGVTVAVADDIAAGKRPASLTDDEAVVFDFAVELLTRGEVSDAAFAKARELLGEGGVIDLVGTVGYYSAVAMTLNVDRHPVPADAPTLAAIDGGFLPETLMGTR